MGQSYNFKSDAWMLGCVFYEMCTLARPFEGESLSQVVNKIIRDPYRPIDTNHFSEPIFEEILSMLLHKNANLRASISEVIDLPELQSRVQKFSQMNQEYLVRQESFNREEAKLEIQRNADRLADALDEMDREENLPDFDHVVMGQIQGFHHQNPQGSGLNQGLLKK